MSFHHALSLTITHGFWGDEAPPLRIVPRDPAAFVRAGLIAKHRTAHLDVVAETALLTDPLTLELDVIATNPALSNVTAGVDWATLPCVDLGKDADTDLFTLSAHLADNPPVRAPGDPLFKIDLILPVTGLRAVTLHCDAVSALWAYHITGLRAQGPLSVVDPDKQTSFADMGQTALPDGQTARVLRSTTPLPVQYRSPARFALEEQQDPPFDPITLVPVLPAAGLRLRAPSDPSAPHSLQSDIFVSLW